MKSMTMTVFGRGPGRALVSCMYLFLGSSVNRIRPIQSDRFSESAEGHDRIPESSSGLFSRPLALKGYSRRVLDEDGETAPNDHSNWPSVMRKAQRTTHDQTPQSS